MGAQGQRPQAADGIGETPEEAALSAYWRAASPLLREADGPFMLLDSAGNMISTTGALAGLLPQELVGNAFSDLVEAADQTAVGNAIREAIVPGIAQGVEVTIHGKGDARRAYQLGFSPVNAPGHLSPVGVFVTAYDTTARRAVEERLRRSERLMVDTQGTAHLGTWEWDVTKPHATWSDELYRIYGLQPSDHVPTYEDYLERIHPDDRARVAAATEAVMRDGKPYSHDERVFHSDGTMRYLHTWAEAMRDEQGKVARLVGVCQDITDRKEKEVALERSLLEKDILLKEVHHRVKNNLQVVMSLLNMQASIVEDPAATSALLDSRDRVRSMALVHETLYRNADMTQIDFAAYVNGIAATAFRAHGVDPERVKLEVDTARSQIPLDTAAGAGLIVNELVTNALKHAFPDGRAGVVRVKIKPTDEYDELIVSDDGVGIPPDVSFPTNDTLGLQLVSALASQLDAEIQLDRENGTTWSLRIPRGGR